MKRIRYTFRGYMVLQAMMQQVAPRSVEFHVCPLPEDCWSLTAKAEAAPFVEDSANTLGFRLHHEILSITPTTIW